MKQTEYTQIALQTAADRALQDRCEFILPEHLLLAFLEQEPFASTFDELFLNMEKLRKELETYLESQEKVPENIPDYEIGVSSQTDEIIRFASYTLASSQQDILDVPHLVNGLMHLEDSQANYLLQHALEGLNEEFLSTLISRYEETLERDYAEEDERSQPWKTLVTCMNEHLTNHNPLIGREEELERTIQVLCRKEKNNPLHVGEPGVGKTALVYGLAARMERGEVPDRLKGYRIYEMDLGSLLAGTQFRGDFEKRLKMVMDGIRQEGKAIVYIDEIHNLVGAGQTSEGSMDASNMLKPYLEGGEIRFIGSTTYEEYNRHFSKSKGLIRRFQQIDILEPSVEESISILEGLKEKYESFHGVTYAEDVIPFAVESSARFVNDRYLPDKAIDLIDEAGAYRELHAETGNVVDKQLISNVLSKVCKVESLALEAESDEKLEQLESQMKALIYGQDEAIRQVTEAVQLSKAGLTPENKPIASLLFVGPTGVGKTEVAKVLAQKLGISLVRFDMSEYTEKHTVAKLIGSPAGYVGYEDGGLLTDAIRKSPNCVLLLDEIEKAHQDIYSILLQVMDYAKLTDNKGHKADFRHVILIMTSNAGAQFAHQDKIGFTSSATTGSAMLKQVKKTFKPEFINRLSATVVFNEMDLTMAGLILDKKLRELNLRLLSKQVEMTLSPQAREYLLKEGFTPEYGAREMDRILQQKLTPLFMKEILFGQLRNGGKADVILFNNSLKLNL